MREAVPVLIIFIEISRGVFIMSATTLPANLSLATIAPTSTRPRSQLLPLRVLTASASR